MALLALLESASICRISYGDMPLNNIQPYGNTSSIGDTVRADVCIWSGQTLTIGLPDVLLREWYGIGSKGAYIWVTNEQRTGFTLLRANTTNLITLQIHPNGEILGTDVYPGLPRSESTRLNSSH